MLKKIAVILRGHKRTWEYTKQTIFNFFADKAEVVDYYVSWWRTGSATYESINNDFIGKRLKACKLTDEIRQYCDPFYSPSFLSNLLIKDIAEEELSSGQCYDLIIETRPDVIHYGHTFASRWFCQDRSIGFTKINIDNGEVVGLTDHCYVAKSHSLFLYNTKVNLNIDYNFNPPLRFGHHTFYLRFMDYVKLEYWENPWFNSIIIRPTICDFEKYNMNSFYKSSDIWNFYNKQQRIDIINKAGIPLSDYDLHLETYLPK